MGILSKFKNIFTGNNTLYYPGCLTKFVLPEIEENYKKILNNLGIEFVTISDEFCCGSPVLNAGYKDDFYNLKKQNYGFFKKYGIGKIITNCPACYFMFKKHYPDIEVQHIISVIHRNLKKIQNKQSYEATYHDPCHLGKHSGIFEEPREILKKTGIKLKEFTENKENSLCCGGGGVLINNFPEIANKIARLRLSHIKTKTLITPCPMCYKHLKNNSDDIEILEFSEALL
ncbi:(Fe-S)-binding protein [Candidatus Woesearchaeota archaeon]|nr:(Fe-S)-binding protein [Candidatus Woesearchaeota archaeon]MBW3021856.1 (Fe-S)-binding protein [Candidatus Woesearchaeota archaeon]